MASSEDSDIESSVTLLEGGEDFGAMLESDSLNDFYLPLPDVPTKRSNRMMGNQRKTTFSDQEEPIYSKRDVKEIYKELQAISSKLKEENRILQEREQSIRERERMVSISQDNIHAIAEHQLKQKLSVIEQKYQNEIDQLEQALKEKSKENKRLKDNFETLKLANDALKKDSLQIFLGTATRLTTRLGRNSGAFSTCFHVLVFLSSLLVLNQSTG
ncbi:hypothetical protein ScPMuIL_011577 [Solemya velum]